MYGKNNIQPNINSLLSENKTIPLGIYDQLIPNTNTKVWDGSRAWNSPRRWQRKSWVFVGAYSPDIYVGFAIVDAGFIGKAFCYVYFPKTGQLLENGIDRPFAFDNNFEANLDSTWQLGTYEIKSNNNHLSFDYEGKGFQLSIQCINNEHGLSFVCPSTGGKRPFHFTYKNLLLPTNIQFTQKGKTQKFNNLMAGIDFSKGYPPRHTTWNWTSFSGKLDDGTSIGINVVNQFNQNMENVVWIGNERILIGDVEYHYQKPLEKSLWTVEAVNQELELSMRPNGSRKENLNLMVLKSKFIQVFGTIEGRIKHQGVWKNFKGDGVMEEHEAIW